METVPPKASRHLWAKIRRVLTKSGDSMASINDDDDDDDDDDDGERLLESRGGREMCRSCKDSR
jgi:hypothetical protein